MTSRSKRQTNFERFEKDRDPTHDQHAASKMMNLFGFTSSGPDVDIFLTDEDKRHHVDVRLDKDRKEKFPLYADGETVSGKVSR